MLNTFKYVHNIFCFQSWSCCESARGLSLLFYTHSFRVKTNTIFTMAYRPAQTSLVRLTSWPVFSDSPHGWRKCKIPRETNGLFYCVEYLLHTQDTRVDIKDLSIEEFPIVLEMRPNNTRNNMRTSCY